MLEDQDRRTRLSGGCSLDATRSAGSAIVRLYGEFDIASEDGLHDELTRHLEGAYRLVLDLRGLTFMDSTGLGMLIQLQAAAVRDGFELEILCSSEGNVRTILRQTGLDGVLPVVDGFGAVPATDSPV